MQGRCCTTYACCTTSCSSRQPPSTSTWRHGLSAKSHLILSATKKLGVLLGCARLQHAPLQWLGLGVSQVVAAATGWCRACVQLVWMLNCLSQQLQALAPASADASSAQPYIRRSNTWWQHNILLQQYICKHPCATNTGRKIGMSSCLLQQLGPTAPLVTVSRSQTLNK